MANFEKSIAVVLRHEGGYVNRPNDLGGPTKYGLTVKDWYAYFRVVGKVTDIQSITPELATEMYKALFWNNSFFTKINSDIFATVLFDQCILSGKFGTVSCLQNLLGLKPDGIIGEETLRYVNACDGKALSFKFIRAMTHHYAVIAATRPSQIEFLGGWIDRLFSLLDLLFFEDTPC